MTRSMKKVVLGLAALAALALGGSAIAGAESTTTNQATTTTTAPGTEAKAPGTEAKAPGNAGGPGPGFTSADAPGTAAHENAEKKVTGADAEKAIAAALATVSGGKAGEVTTDYFAKGYEVDVTKSDGTKVSVHLDGSFKVQTHPPAAGRPMGAPGGAPPGGQAPNGQPPQSAQTPNGY